MATLDPSAVAASWAAGMNNAATKIRNGVQAVSVAPGIAAAAQAQKMLTGVQNAINSGKWQNNVKSVSLQSWQQSMTTKGLQNMSTGVAAAGPKVIAFHTWLLPQTAAISAQIKAMPSATPADMQQRMIANFQKMSALKYQRQAG